MHCATTAALITNILVSNKLFENVMEKVPSVA